MKVVVGTSTGQLGLFDWRAGAGSYRGLVRKLGGCVGAIRSLATSGDNRHCGAVGLDRFLRVTFDFPFASVLEFTVRTSRCGILARAVRSRHTSCT